MSQADAQTVQHGTPGDHGAAHGHAGEAHVHAVPLKVLIGVWLGLVVLTVVTVMATLIDLGEFNIWLALLIATVKAALVALYFMHLRWDSLFNGIILICALLFVSVFIVITLADTVEYQDDFRRPPGISATP